MLCNRKSLLVLMLVTTSVLSGCDTIRDFFGSSRTVPDGASVKFNNSHAPALNPGGAGDVTTTGQDSSSAAGARHVPVENLQAAAAAVPTDTSVTAPVTPVTNTPMPAAPTPSSAYPTLASVPPNPTYPAKPQNTADMSSLNAEHDLSESMRQELVSNPNATVMTSPVNGGLVNNPEEATTPLSAPPHPVAPAPIAIAPVTPSGNVTLNTPSAADTSQAAQSDSGFGHWLHHLFSSDTSTSSNVRKPINAADTTTAAAPAAPVTVAPPAPVAVSATLPPVSSTPAISNVNAAPLTIPAPASVAVTTPPAAQTVSSAPVHLHPPQATMTDNAASPVIEQMPAQPAAPVTLTPPPSNLSSVTSSDARYLSDSRYAARRAYVPADADAPSY